MKRYRFVVLVLLIIAVTATGCRRNSRIFGLRGAPCGQAPVAAPTPTPFVLQAPVCPTPVCPTPVCPTPACPPAECCPTYGGEVIGGDTFGGQITDGGSYGGTVYEGAPSFNTVPPANVAPSIPDDSGFRPADNTGAFNYGLQPPFQVIGDRKLEPGESLPPIDDTATVSAKSDQTAQAPKQ